MEHLNETNDVVVEVWQVYICNVISQAFDDPVKVHLDALTKGIITYSSLKSLERLKRKHFLLASARDLVQQGLQDEVEAAVAVIWLSEGLIDDV